MELYLDYLLVMIFLLSLQVASLLATATRELILKRNGVLSKSCLAGNLAFIGSCKNITIKDSKQNKAWFWIKRKKTLVFLSLKPYTMNNIRPLLDNGQKGGNSESPERASLCNQSGVCLYAYLSLCDQTTGHSFWPSNLILLNINVMGKSFFPFFEI